MTGDASNADDRSHQIDAAIAEYLEAMEQGTPPEREAFLARHADIADELREFLADDSVFKRESPQPGSGNDATSEQSNDSANPMAAASREPAQTSDLIPAIAPGTTVGTRYRLLEVIGEGGMGTVWTAEQREPVRRLVALKLIKPGMASKSVLARFDAERQAVALMDHPNIAKVFDGGTTEDGRPYFVMELVKGIPLTQYCDDRRLPVPARLNLFLQVCQAVQHAHQKGIIHRDIKPTNILVTEHDGRPVPKVIDFGLAKALQGPHALTEQTLFTAFGALVGTPLYMAPEQVGINALDVDTRSDVYAMGVILYELLTGSTPLEKQRFKKAAWEEICRLIREEEPPRPSLRLSSSDASPSIAACRHTEPAKLGRLLRGDLDWIVLKALEKDRTRRYETAIGLAADIQRHLDNEPVQASPPSAAYRLRKFIRRNKGLALATAVVAFTLIVGIIGTSLGLLRAEQQREVAEEAKQRAVEQRTEAIAARDAADRAANQSQRQTALMTLQRALTLCEQGDVTRGVLWLGRALESAHQAGADDVEQDCRFNLDAWSCQLPRLKFVLPHGDVVWAAALSTDKQVIASGCKDGKLHVWNSATGEPLAPPRQLNSAVKVVAIHPHQPIVLAGCEDGTVTLWNWATREPSGQIMHHEGAVSSAAFTSDGKTLLTASYDGTAKLWTTETCESIGEPMHHLDHSCPGWSRGIVAAISPDGELIATGGGDDWSIRFWNTRNGQSTNRAINVGAVIRSLAWSPKGKEILIGEMQTRVAGRFDVDTLKPVGAKLAHLAFVNSVAYSADGTTIVTAGNDHCVQLWSGVTGGRLGVPLEHPGDVQSVAISADGQTIISADSDSTVRVWEKAPGNLIRTIYGPNWIRAAEFSPDGRSILLGASGGGAQIWDIATGGKGRTGFQGPSVGWVEGVAFSPDGKTVFTTNHEDQVVQSWDSRTGRFLGSTPVHGDEVWRMALSPDGSKIVSGNYRNARLWDAVTLKQIGLPLQHPKPGRVFALAFSPDSKLVLTGSQDGTTQLWSAVTGQPLGLPVKHSNEISSLAFSPDGQTIVIGGGSHAAQLWDAKSWQPLKVPMELRSDVQSVIFTVDGRAILTGGTDGIGRLWNAATCRPIGPMLHHSDAINVVRCSPDGRIVLTASDDHTVKLWSNPDPLSGSVEQVVRLISLITGMQLDENAAVHMLDFETWQATNRKFLAEEHSAMLASLNKLARLRLDLNKLARDAMVSGAQGSTGREAPISAHALVTRGRYAATRQQWDQAAADFSRAIDISEDTPAWNSARKIACVELAQWDEVFSRVNQLRPAETTVWIGRGQFHALRSQWDQAVADYAKVIHTRPVHDDAIEYAGLLLLSGDSPGYEQFCKELVARPGEPQDAFTAFIMARACAMGTTELADPLQAIQWADQGVKAKLSPWRVHVLGLAYYRAGQYDLAIQNLQKSNDIGWNSKPEGAQNWLVLAMAHSRLGRVDQARKCLETAQHMIMPVKPAHLEDPVGLPTTDWIELQVLFREAEALIGGESPAISSSQSMP